VLNHLDDPEPHAFPDDFRRRVDQRGRELRRRRRLGLTGAAAVAVGALGATGLYRRARTRIDDVDRVTVAGTGDPADEQRTILLAGVDGPGGGPTRTDTMLVVRLEGGRASVLSIPRDLAVAGPDGAEVRANTVAAEHGYAALVDILAGFGIDVDNVIEVDFAGFAQLVDLAGGIDVHAAAPLRDEMTGLAIETTGCHRLDGDEALARARRLERLEEGRWRADPTGDLGRIARQPALLAAGLDALTRTRPDPLTADRLAGWLVDHATVDDTLGNDELIGLLGTVMALDPGDVTFTTLPVEAHTLDGGATVLRATPEAEQTISAWRDGRTTTTSDSGTLIGPCPPS
jgi:LCP family protein required for cell wall assembly